MPFSAAVIPVDAKTAISVICGVFLLPHTIAKLAISSGRRSCSTRSASARPHFFVVLTAILELIAGFGLITGLYPRIGALMAAAILVVAAYAIARVHGLKWRWQHPGIEYMLFWAAVCLCAAFLP